MLKRLTNFLLSWINFIQHFSSFIPLLLSPCIFYRPDIAVKSLLGSKLNFQLMQECKQPVFTNCTIWIISWLHTPNLSLSINLIITKYVLKSQYVKLTQLWPLTVNCVKVGSQSYLASLTQSWQAKQKSVSFAQM